MAVESRLDGLFEVAAGDPSPPCRVAAFDALSRLPLQGEDLDRAARLAIDLLERPEVRSFRGALARSAARLPHERLRSYLGEVAEREEPDEGFRIASELARHGSVAGIGRLIRALEVEPTGDAVERLAALPIEAIKQYRFPKTRLSLLATRAEDPDVRLWSAIALARLGSQGPLKQQVVELLEPDGSLQLRMTSGNPWTPYQRLQAVRPLPPKLERMLVELHRSYAERKRVRLMRWPILVRPLPAGYEPPRDARIVIGGLTGIYDAEGHLQGERLPDRGGPPSEPSEPVSDVSIEPLMDSVIAATDTWERIRLGNELLDVSSRRRAGSPRVSRFLERHVGRVDSLPDAVAWVLARTPPMDLAVDVSQLASEESDPRRRLVTLVWLGQVLSWRDKDAPYAGAGGSEADEPLFGTHEVLMLDPSGRAGAPHEALEGHGPGAPDRTPPRASRPRTAGPGPADTVGRRSGGTEAPSAGGGPDQPLPPRRTAWPHIACDDLVAPGQQFLLEVGIAPAPVAGVATPAPLSIPTGAFGLDVEIFLDPNAFRIVEGSSRMTIRVASSSDFPKHTLKLEALAGDDLAELRTITAVFSVAGTACGVASRQVRVAADPGRGEAPPPPEGARVPTGFDVTPPSIEETVDLTIEIRRGDDRAGRTLVFSILGAGVPQPGPDEAMDCRLGGTPENTLRDIMQKGSTATSAQDLYYALRGFGRDIWGKLPAPVQRALDFVAKQRAPEPATVLVLSQDPYVPWELALPDPPLAPGSASPFLGGQVLMGRWVLADGGPPLRPPLLGEVREAVVVRGDYQGVAGWSRLEGALDEARQLAELPWGFVPVEALRAPVFDCLKGRPAGEVLHFAVHGKFDLAGSIRGIVLAEPIPGNATQKRPFYLTAEHVKGAAVRHPRFVFLNACQVAAANEVLGDYAGLAAAFLDVGAYGVVAPLWNIHDGEARDIALGFYPSVLDRGESPAQVLFRQRQRLCEATVSESPDDIKLGTHVAYQYFGHPRMSLTRVKP